MGFIKELFKNDTAVVGLCELQRRQPVTNTIYTRTYALNQLFTEPIDENILLRKVL